MPLTARLKRRKKTSSFSLVRSRSSSNRDDELVCPLNLGKRRPSISVLPPASDWAFTYTLLYSLLRVTWCILTACSEFNLGWVKVQFRDQDFFKWVKSSGQFTFVPKTMFPLWIRTWSHKHAINLENPTSCSVFQKKRTILLLQTYTYTLYLPAFVFTSSVVCPVNKWFLSPPACFLHQKTLNKKVTSIKLMLQKGS